MDIFNISIFGDDALDFCSWSKSNQKEWIKKMTNQQSDTVIDEFLSNPLKIGGTDCRKCGVLNNIIVKHDSNISKGDATESSVDSNTIMAEGQSERDSTIRPKGTKRKKG